LLANPTGRWPHSLQLPNQTVLTATATTSAPPGIHQIVVSNLAIRRAVYTNPLADGNTSILTGGATTGDITLQVGGLAGRRMTCDHPGPAMTPSTTLADYINKQKLGL